MQPVEISATTARRYLLGIQGLWPGRRWSGPEGAEQALLSLGSVQMDPMTIVARSHDLILWSRVDGYDPTHLDRLLYQDRKFFDYGGHLDIYPMNELPCWRIHMKRRMHDDRWSTFAGRNQHLIDEVRELVRDSGPLSSRDFQGNTQVTSYRGTKDTSLALYYLWLTGELMTHSRKGFERLYDLRERIVPRDVDYEVPESEAEWHFAVSALRQLRLGIFRAWADAYRYPLHRSLGRPELQATMNELIEQGEAMPVLIEGQKDPHYAPASDRTLLEQLQAGVIPEVWAAQTTTTDQAVIFLSPIDNLLARNRTRMLFDFEYLWEVYKPAEKRRWGYYTMPVLYQDRLVARIDPKLDRKSSTLIVNGFWPEDDKISKDPSFLQALSKGLARFAQFHSAQQIDASAVQDKHLQRRLQALDLRCTM